MSNLSKTIAILGVVAGLGVAALPLSTYAADPASDDTTVTLKLDEILQITATETVALSSTSPITGSEYSGSATVNVKANTKGGYWLGIMGATSTTEGAAATKTTQMASATDVIESAALATGTSAWAWKGGDVTEWTTVPEANTLVYQGSETDLNTTEGTDTTVDFGATVAKDQPAGTYTGKVTFTATAGVKGA